MALITVPLSTDIRTELLTDIDGVMGSLGFLDRIEDLAEVGARLALALESARKEYAARTAPTFAPAPVADPEPIYSDNLYHFGKCECGKALTPATQDVGKCMTCWEANRVTRKATYLKAICPDCQRTWTTSDLGTGTISKVCGFCLKETPVETAPPADPYAGIEITSSWDGDIVDGTYTVVRSDGYRTLKIQTQAPDANFMPGERIASYLNGPDNWKNYKGFAFIKPGNMFKVWKKFQDNKALIRDLAILLSGPEAMVDGLRAYGKASGSCGMCGRKLTTPESLELGIGPICAARLGI